MKRDGAPIAGVTVKVGGQTSVTDEEGAYALSDVPVGSYVVSFEHPEYVFAQRRMTIELGDEAWMVQELLPRSAHYVIKAEEGAIVKEGPLTLEFEPQDLVIERDQSPVKGDVEVVVTAIDPRVEGHIEAAPAELEGLTASGEQVGLFSFGMLEVELFQGGKKVNVRRGETVKTSFDITKGIPLAAGETIPMWHHDTELGIWVEEQGTTAVVEEQGRALVAVAELPHFSAWNYDFLSDGICAPLVVPASMNISRVRVISTDANGNVATGTNGYGYQHYWSVSFDCAALTGRSTRCVVNVPAGTYSSEVYFKIQVLPTGGSTWCDLTLALNGQQKVVWTRQDVNTYVANNQLPTSGSWCGNQRPTAPYAQGDYNFTLGQYTLPTNRISFGTPVSSTCAGVGAQALAQVDSGFSALASNAAVAAYTYDFDRDNIGDNTDTCIANTSSAQTDSDANGIGDMCEGICYVPASDPMAQWYDFDNDGVDDYCDNLWSTYNPSQYFN
jgi:hypothetical protein